MIATHKTFLSKFLPKFLPFALSLMLSVAVLMPTVAGAASLLNPDIFPCSGTAAVGTPDASGAVEDRECTFGDVVKAVSAIASVIVKIGLIVAPLIFAYVGYIFLTSGGNPTARKEAAKIGKNVVIGLAIMLSAWVVVNFVLGALVCNNVFSSAGFPFKPTNATGGPGCTT